MQVLLVAAQIEDVYNVNQTRKKSFDPKNG